jgi:hypothetical protein
MSGILKAFFCEFIDNGRGLTEVMVFGQMTLFYICAREMPATNNYQ